jgi:hypothetical protein
MSPFCSDDSGGYNRVDSQLLKDIDLSADSTLAKRWRAPVVRAFCLGTWSTCKEWSSVPGCSQQTHVV